MDDPTFSFLQIGKNKGHLHPSAYLFQYFKSIRKDKLKKCHISLFKKNAKMILQIFLFLTYAVGISVAIINLTGAVFIDERSLMKFCGLFDTSQINDLYFFLIWHKATKVTWYKATKKPYIA